MYAPYTRSVSPRKTRSPNKRMSYSTMSFLYSEHTTERTEVGHMGAPPAGADRDKPKKERKMAQNVELVFL